jgi:hypothetical protein
MKVRRERSCWEDFMVKDVGGFLKESEFVEQTATGVVRNDIAIQNQTGSEAPRFSHRFLDLLTERCRGHACHSAKGTCEIL